MISTICGCHAVLALLSLSALVPSQAAAEEKRSFPSFADAPPVALWLFDDVNYPSATITDASEFESDLHLMPGGELVPGRFGRALRVLAGSEPAAAFAGFQGAISLKHMR